MIKFKSKLVHLPDIVTLPIQTGFQIRGRIQFHPIGNYNLVQVKDVDRSKALYQIRTDALNKISIPEKKRKFIIKYLLKKDDILYLSKLHPAAFCYKGSFGDTIPMSHFYILRPNIDVIYPDYLCWALNQKFIIQPYVQKHLSGSVLPFISGVDLMKFKIPLPSKDVQKKIIKLLHLAVREKEIQEKIDKKQNILINTLLKRAL